MYANRKKIARTSPPQHSSSRNSDFEAALSQASASAPSGAEPIPPEIVPSEILGPEVSSPEVSLSGAEAPGKDSFRFPPVERLMKRLGLRTNRRRGQHFLKRAELGERIIQSAAIEPGDMVVEIGAGLGNLSVPLARRAHRVHAIELDRRFEPWHVHLQFYYPNLTFHYIDFLEAPLEEWTRDCPAPVAVGNLPYYLTSPIIFRLLEGPVRWKKIVVMVQKEVADRMVAAPGGKIYGALSLKVQYYTIPKIVLAVSPGEFMPPPKVHSRIVSLSPRPDPLGGDEARRRSVFRLIEMSFQHRRKTLANSLLSGGFPPDRREDLLNAIIGSHIEPERRPETLALDDYFRLEEALRGAGITFSKRA